MHYYSNGFLIREYYDTVILPYKGVNGYSWPLLYTDVKNVDNNEVDSLNKYYKDYIDKSWQKEYCDLDYVKKYVNKCKELKIKIDVIFCMTTIKRPLFKNPDEYLGENNFLGYDYAYPGGSFYSCIYYELVNKEIKEFYDIKLNENGLLKTEEELKDYIIRRKELSDKNDPRLELGDFIEYKLWDCNEIFK